MNQACDVVVSSEFSTAVPDAPSPTVPLVTAISGRRASGRRTPRGRRSSRACVAARPRWVSLPAMPEAVSSPLDLARSSPGISESGAGQVPTGARTVEAMDEITEGGDRPVPPPPSDAAIQASISLGPTPNRRVRPVERTPRAWRGADRRRRPPAGRVRTAAVEGRGVPGGGSDGRSTRGGRRRARPRSHPPRHRRRPQRGCRPGPRRCASARRRRPAPRPSRAPDRRR